MGAIIYLTLTQLKNRLLGMFRTKRGIILFVCLILFIAFMVFASVTATQVDVDPSVALDDVEDFRFPATSVLTFSHGLMLLTFLATVFSGFVSGGSMFSMQEVNLMFTSPIRSNTVLFYGIIRQLGVSALAGVYFAFQIPNLISISDLSLFSMIFLIFGYILTLLASSLLGMLIYLAIDGEEKRRFIAKFIFGAYIVAIIAILGFKALNSAEMLPTLLASGSSDVMLFLPFTGWVTAGVLGIHTGNILMAALGFGACLVAVVGLAIATYNIHSDYYEDVMATAEIKFTVATAVNQGAMVEATPKKVKVGETGLGKGFGANSIFYKINLENRRAKTQILSTMQIISLIISAIVAFAIFKAEPDADFAVLMSFMLGAYIQIFAVSAARWARELMYHTIYMIPDSAFKKLLHCIREAIPSAIAESVAMAVILGVMLKLSPLLMIGIFVAKFSFSMLIVGANLFCERVFGFIHSKLILVMLYMITIFVSAIPPLLIAIFASAFLELEMYFGLIIFGAVSLLITLLYVFIARNVLEYPEINS